MCCFEVAGAIQCLAVCVCVRTSDSWNADVGIAARPASYLFLVLLDRHKVNPEEGGSGAGHCLPCWKMSTISPSHTCGW